MGKTTISSSSVPACLPPLLSLLSAQIRAPRNFDSRPFLFSVRYGWVIAAVSSTAWLGLWQATRVAFARHAAGIAYPQGWPSSLGRDIRLLWNSHLRFPPAYAEKAEVEKSEAAYRFNCAQRESSITWLNFPDAKASSQAHTGTHWKTFHSLSHRELDPCTISCAHLDFPRRSGLIFGLKKPVHSAAAVGFWVLTKALYTVGYIRKGPNGVRTILGPPRVRFPADAHFLFHIPRGLLVQGRTYSLCSVSSSNNPL